MPSGVVRAFDARTGTLCWSWNPILPKDESAPSSNVRGGAAGAWSIMSVDAERDLIFVPTGSASPDYYGGLRPGDNEWADSVVALHARTGQLAWGFQLVHHDLWDYDTAPAPLLATLPHNGRQVPVVIAGNKTGFLYTLDRGTGAPVFPVEERPVPQSDVPGEVTFPTQPFPLAPPALVPQKLAGRGSGFGGPDPEHQEQCRKQLEALRNEGVFTPPSLRGTLAIPGNIGGVKMLEQLHERPSAEACLVVNTTTLPFWVKLVPAGNTTSPVSNELRAEYGSQLGAPYAMMRAPLFSSVGLPCSRPPWGTLVAVDMEKGKLRWQAPLGSMQGFGGSQAQAPPGSLSLGGPIVTAGGLVFVAGTIDPYMRAFDVANRQRGTLESAAARQPDTLPP